MLSVGSSSTVHACEKRVGMAAAISSNFGLLPPFAAPGSTAFHPPQAAAVPSPCSGQKDGGGGDRGVGRAAGDLRGPHDRVHKGRLSSPTVLHWTVHVLEAMLRQVALMDSGHSIHNLSVQCLKCRPVSDICARNGITPPDLQQHHRTSSKHPSNLYSACLCENNIRRPRV